MIKLKYKILIFIIFISIFGLNSKINADFGKNIIKNIIPYENIFHISLSESVIDFDLNYDNFENFIEIEPSLKTKCKWINSKNLNCSIINSEKIIPEKSYLIKIFDPSNNFKDSKKNLIFQKNIILKQINFDHIEIKSWETKNIPILKIVLNDFLEKEKFIQNLRIINESTKRTYSLKNIENIEKYLDHYEIKENNELFEKKFHNWGDEKQNILKAKYQKIFFVRPISILEENTNYNLSFKFEDNKNKLEDFSKIEKEIFNFKTFSKKPEFLGIECLNYQFKTIKFEINNKDKIYEDDHKCIASSGINLLFSSEFNKSDIINNFNFSPEINKILKEKDNYSSEKSEKTNPYKIFLPIQENLEKISISYDPNNKNYIKIFNNSKQKQKKLQSIFGDDFNQKFEIEFMIAKQAPFFHEENYKEILNLSNQDDENLFLLRNIKDIQINYDLVQSDKITKNLIYKKNFDELPENLTHKVKLDLKNILENKNGILYGEITANPIQDKLYEKISNKIFFQNTSIDVFIKTYNDTLTIIPFEIKTNTNIRNAEIFIKEISLDDFIQRNFEKAKTIKTDQTNQEGILEIKDFKSILDFNNTIHKVFFVEIKKNNEIAWAFLKFDSLENFKENPMDEIMRKHNSSLNENFYKKFKNIEFLSFPDSFVHQTNEKLFYKIYLKKLQKDFDLKSFIQNFKFDLYLCDQNLSEENPKKYLLIKKNLDFNNKFLQVSDYFDIPENITLGNHDLQIKVSDIKNEENYNFVSLFEIQIQHFEKVDFNFNFNIDKEKILGDEQFKISTEKELYTNSKKEKSKIEITVDSKEKSFFPKEENLKDFIFDNQAEYYIKNKNIKNKKERILFFESKIDDNGIFQKKISFENYLFPYGELDIQAKISDENQKNISKQKKIEYFGSDIFIGIKKNNNKNFSIIAVDSKKNLLKNLEVYSFIDKKNLKNEWARIDKKISKIGENSLSSIDFDLKTPGQYRIASYAKNNFNKQIASFEFFIENETKQQISPPKENLDEKNIPEIELISSEIKKTSESDQKIELKIKNPFSSFSKDGSTRALIFIENASKSIFIQKNLNLEIESIEIPIYEEFLGKFDLRIIIFDQINKKNIFRFFKKEIFIKDELIKNFESFNFLSDKEVYTPGENVEIKFETNNVELNQKNLECSLISMNQFIFDIQPGEEKIKNFDIFNQIILRKSIFSSEIYHLFKNQKNQIITPRLMMSNPTIDSQKENIFIEKNINLEKNNIIHFEKSFEIDLQNKQEKILSYKIPENFEGSLKNIMICNIPETNHFFTKEFNIKSFKKINIKSSFESKKILSPGEKIDFNIQISNNNEDYKKQNKEFKITLRIDDPYFLKNISEFNFFNIKSEKILKKNEIKNNIEKIFDLNNEDKFKISLGIKENINYEKDKDLKIEVDLYEKDEKNEYQKIESKELNFLIKSYESKQTIIEQEIIKDNKIFEKNLKLSKDLSGINSKINISLSKTILNNLENLFWVAQEFDENLIRFCFAKIFALEVYDFFIQKESFLNAKIFENFTWNDYKKNLQDLNLKIKKYQNEENQFKEILTSEKFEKNIFLAAQKLFILNLENKIINEVSLENSKEKNNLIKFLLNSLDDPDLILHKELKAYVLYVLSLSIEILNFNEIKAELIKLIKNHYDEMNLEGKIFTLYGFLNLNESNEKNFNFLTSEFEKILQKYGKKNGLFIHLQENSGNNKIVFRNEFNDSSNLDQCVNCTSLSFLIDFVKKFNNSEFLQKNSFDFELPFIFAQTIINRDFKINYNNPNQFISCLYSFLNYAINFEKITKNNNDNDQIEFEIFLNDSLSSKETISIPNYIEIENITQFLDKNILFKINQEDENNKIIYFLMKLDLYKKFQLKDPKESKNFNPENEQVFGINLKKEYFKYDPENGDFIKIDNLETAKLKKGDILKINLKIKSNEEKKFIVLEDFIPNFGIFFDQNLISNEKILNNESNINSQPIIKDQNIRFYLDKIYSGERNISYLIKINTTGKFNLFPANIKEIYNQEISGETEGYKNIIIFDENI